MATKHFLKISDLKQKELLDLIKLAEKLKAEWKKGKDQSKYLKGKSLALIFEKPSLRTRVSFEVGMKELGGNTVVIKNDEIQMGGRETISDIAKVLSQYLSAVMIRTFGHDIIDEFANNSSIPVINGLTDFEHPCQIMADLLTIKEQFKKLKNLKICYVGDGNNVSRSLMLACETLGLDFCLSCPKGYELELPEGTQKSTINHSVAEAISDADVIYTDVWTSMGQEAETEKRLKDFNGYQINKALLEEYAKKNAIVLHCLPAHRGEEITAEAFTLHEESILRQAQNRMHAQKAILVNLLKK